MNKYKGISLSKNDKLRTYIQTYHSIDSELTEAYMESDAPLQRIVKNHYLKRNILIALYNISIYIIIYSIIVKIKG